MLRIFILLLVVAWASACSSRSAPELTLQKYADAVNESRCSDALTFLSARTIYSVDALRVKPQRPREPLPIEYYYCNKLVFEDCLLKKMTLADQQGDTAKISMPCGRTQDSFLPGFSSVFLKYEPRVTELVREEGMWHVVDPVVIRIVEIRETEDRMRDAALRQLSER